MEYLLIHGGRDHPPSRALLEKLPSGHKVKMVEIVDDVTLRWAKSSNVPITGIPCLLGRKDHETVVVPITAIQEITKAN